MPLHGSDAGKAKRVASAPQGAELTGPFFLPDGESMLLAVQHPHNWKFAEQKNKPSSVLILHGPLMKTLLKGKQ